MRLWVKPDLAEYVAINWYANANSVFYDAFGPDSNFFIDILSATSPRLRVKANLRLAVRVFKAYKYRGHNPRLLGDILGSLMPAHCNNVLRVLQGKPLQGPKVSRFAANLKGDLSVVTIDIWICRAYGIGEKRLTPLQYDRLEKKIQGEAYAENLKPAQYQALIWYAARRKGGYVTDQSFIRHSEEILGELLAH